MKISGILTIDIDNFKKINDAHGHDVGDLALQHLAETVRKVIRERDLFGRLGGEEFIIGSSKINFSEFLEVSERVRSYIEKSPLSLPEKILTFTVSGGIYHTMTGFKSISESLKISDQHLYNAKNNGRNRIEFE